MFISHDAINESADANSNVPSWYNLFRSSSNERPDARSYFIDAERPGSNTGHTTQPQFTAVHFIHSTRDAQFWASPPAGDRRTGPQETMGWNVIITSLNDRVLALENHNRANGQRTAEILTQFRNH